MTIKEWAEDFKSFVNELQMPRDDYKGIMLYIDDALAMLKEQPDIVRCKDCKHYKDGFCYNPNSFDDGKTCGNTTPDWFCADGGKAVK